MRFLGYKFTQNVLAAEAPGELKRSPRPSSRFQGAASRQGKDKGGERGRRRERGKGERGIGEGKEGGKGRENGMEERGKEEEREEGGVCVIGVGG